MSPCMALIRGKMRLVTDLGWLLHHWREVSSFKVSKPSRDPFCKFGTPPEAFLEAYNQNGVLIYQTDFASSSLLWYFLDRRIFRGLDIDWFGIKTVCGENTTFGALLRNRIF